MNKRFILLVLCGLSSSISHAQFSLSGYTFDIITGKPLEGVELALYDGFATQTIRSNTFGRYSFDSLSTNAYSLMAAYRMRLSDNQVRVVLRVDAFEATQKEEEMHFGFSSAEVEALMYMSQNESKGNALNSPVMDMRTDSLYQKSYVRNASGKMLPTTIHWMYSRPEEHK